MVKAKIYGVFLYMCRLCTHGSGRPSKMEAKKPLNGKFNEVFFERKNFSVEKLFCFLKAFLLDLFPSFSMLK